MPKEKELLMHIGISKTHISLAAVQTGLPVSLCDTRHKGY